MKSNPIKRSNKPKRAVKVALGTAVNVLVGADQSKFIVHKDLLTANSDFFKAALTGDWKESTSHEVQLPEDDPAAFEMFAHWLYFSKLDFEIKAGSFDNLSEAWFLGDKLQAAAFKIAVIDAFVSTMDKAETLTNWMVINKIYSRTPTGAPLRRLMVDMYVFRGNLGALGGMHTKSSGQLNSEFPVEVGERLMTLWINGDKRCLIAEPYKTNICAYHDHADAEAHCEKI